MCVCLCHSGETRSFTRDLVCNIGSQSVCVSVS